jgi:hypothetical protein
VEVSGAGVTGANFCHGVVRAIAGSASDFSHCFSSFVGKCTIFYNR